VERCTKFFKGEAKILERFRKRADTKEGNLKEEGV
jgi:hypothetical protein